MARPRGGIMARKWERANEILAEVERKFKIGRRDICSRSMRRSIVRARAAVCRRAAAEKIGCVVVGKLLGCHPSTVSYWVNPELRARKNEQRLRRSSGANQGGRTGGDRGAAARRGSGRDIPAIHDAAIEAAGSVGG